jgi:hypothetical protein
MSQASPGRDPLNQFPDSDSQYYIVQNIKDLCQRARVGSEIQ